MDTHQAAHDDYVDPRCQAMEGLREWPDKAGGFDLFVELTASDRIVILQRPFGTDLSEVDLNSRMSMNPDRCMACMGAMGSLL